MAIQIPSATNSVGTLASLAAGALTAYLAKAGLLAAAAAFIGLPEATVSTLAVGLVTALVNYGVTHYAEIKNLNQLVSSWWPVIQQQYPNPPPPPTPNNINQSNG